MEDPNKIFQNYENNLRTNIEPFILTKDEGQKRQFSIFIDTFITIPDDQLLDYFQSNNERAYNHSKMVSKIRDALNKKEIMDTAPWFNKLNEVLMRNEIYVSGTDKDLNKGKKEAEITSKKSVEEIIKDADI